jgi:4-hydroxy-tetrahydrodipicolinate synthase
VLAEELRGRLIPAVPVPFDKSGRLDRDAQARLAEALASRPIGGVAVWAHTGRGLWLSSEARADVLLDWRQALAGHGRVIAAAGASRGVIEPAAAIASARAMAEQAADLGADALLVHPPTFARALPERDRLILDYHAAVARPGLPLILFYLYEEAGGVSYSPSVLADLLSRPETLGIKVATLDSVMTFQDISRLVREQFPAKLLITGEDRFLGYSLMCGAEAALVGMGAACTSMQSGLLESHRNGDAARFLALNALVDELAQHTFTAPMEGYIQRILWCLVHEGALPLASSHDPWAPPLPAGEFDRIGAMLGRINPR